MHPTLILPVESFFLAQKLSLIIASAVCLKNGFVVIVIIICVCILNNNIHEKGIVAQ